MSLCRGLDLKVPLFTCPRLRSTYKLGKEGFITKSAIYNDYLELCELRGAKPIISPTFYGKEDTAEARPAIHHPEGLTSGSQASW